MGVNHSENRLWAGDTRKPVFAIEQVKCDGGLEWLPWKWKETDQQGM